MVTLIKTVYSLGLSNALMFMLYKAMINSFVAKLIFRKGKKRILKQFYCPVSKIQGHHSDKRIFNQAESIVKGNFLFFSFREVYMGMPPNWFMNPFKKNITFLNFDLLWTNLDDFNNSFGDIKNVWEISRFNWLGTLAIAYSISRKQKYLETINHLVSDWVAKNPENRGPNWKCGQEAAIRSINLILANEIIENHKISINLKYILEIHMRRIEKTFYYAKAQQNNHGLCEAIGVFLINAFLNKMERKNCAKKEKKWKKIIEDQVNKLIMDDGCFSQYSVVYHRMVLDLFSVLELLRKKWKLESFSEKFYKKINVAYLWYSSMVDLNSGDAPNFGNNDGTYLFNYTNMEYRDFRPSMSLMASVFNISIAPELFKNHPLIGIFNIKKPPLHVLDLKSKDYRQGGQIKLISNDNILFFRIPQFKFRPAHSDALHIDIWKSGINWIKDAGTFSYAVDEDILDQFSGTKGHSTIQFDNSNQMPRISRFLFGNWLKPKFVKFSSKKISAGSGYIDANGNHHDRYIKSIIGGWEIIDFIKGNFEHVISRFILSDAFWQLDQNKVYCKNCLIKIQSTIDIKIQINKQFVSEFYGFKRSSPVLEVMANNPCEIKTEIIISE